MFGASGAKLAAMSDSSQHQPTTDFAAAGPRLRIGNLELRSRVLPAPMCNISDRAQRTILRDMGADLVCTQMISSEGLTRQDKNTWGLLDIADEEPPVEVQLLGSDPQVLARAAQIVVDQGAATVDLNMGCPARKVTGNDCGSALMRNPQRVAEIVRTIKRAIDKPFTVKMRAGWSDGETSSLELAKICEAEGADAVALHARTREQGYKGHADWALIAEMKSRLSIPVIGNGDVTSPADAVRMFRETGCDAVMIGRGLIGNPWLLRATEEAVQALFDGRIRHESEVPDDDLVMVEEQDVATPVKVPYYMRHVSLNERLDLVVLHSRLMAEAKGERRGVIEMRKHSMQYVRYARGAKTVREALMKACSLAEVEDCIARYREYLASGPAERSAGA
jgi:tRNA-dihydrouridine synthase B